MRLRYLISILFILSGVGSIIFGLYPIIASVLIILGVISSVFSYLASEKHNQELDSIIEIQTMLLAQHNIGNVYTQRFKKELQKTGSVKTGIRLLNKALAVNSNDVEALEYFVPFLSLQFSFLKKWTRKKVDSKEFSEALIFAKNLAQKGISLAPKKHIFYDSLGILYDTEGKHEKARQYFIKSSHLRNDPYWRLLMATSWGMSGEYHKALLELQLSEREGAKGWMFNFYYGRALYSVGNYIQALVYLKSAYNERGNQPELLKVLSSSYRYSGRYISAAKYNFLLSMALILIVPRFAARKMLLSIIGVVIGLIYLASKTFWKVTKYIPIVRRLHLRCVRPDEPEFTLGIRLIEKKGHYEAAEQMFRLCCNIVPYNAASHSNLALSLALQGRKNEALTEFDRAIKIDPKDLTFRHFREQLAAGNLKRLGDSKGEFIRNI